MTKAARKRRPRGRPGITILEVLVVLTIVAMLAAVAGPRLVGYLGRAKSGTAALQIDQIENGLQLFYIDIGRFPTSAEGLPALMSSPSGASDWNGPYLSSEEGLVDPWGRSYLYEETDGDAGFAVRSLGRDGRRGGDGEDADLSS